MRSSFAFLAVAGLVPAQALPEPWRVLRNMEIAGVAAFDRDAIAGQLVWDDVTMKALRRPLDAESAAVVAERVRELHLRGGYAAATASGAVLEGALRITLVAGKRYRAGGVKCTGNTVVATERLRDLLAATEPSSQSLVLNGYDWSANKRRKAAWLEGQFPVMDAGLARRVETIVLAAYQNIGRHGVRAKIEFPPTDDRIELHIAVEDEGHEVRIQSLALVGEDEAQRGPVLAAMRFAPGTLATSAAFVDLQRQFENTGRYLTVKPDLPTTMPASLDPLTIAVTPRPNAPAVGAVSARDAEQVRTAIDRVCTQLAEGRVLRVAIRFTEPVPMGRLEIVPGLVSIMVGRSGVVFALDGLKWGDAPPAPAALQLSPEELTVRYGPRCGRWRLDGVLGIEAQVTTGFGPDGEAGLQWGVGVKTNAGDFLVARIHPATAAHVVAKVDEVHRDGDELMLQAGATKLRIAADASIVGNEVSVTADGTDITMSLAAPPDADEMRRLFPGVTADAPPASTVLMEAAADLLGQAFAAPAGTEPRVEALLRSFAAGAGSGLDLLSRSEPAETLPRFADKASASSESMMAAMALQPAVDRHWQGWIVDQAAAFGSLLSRDTGAASARFRAMLEAQDHGPVSLAVAAAVHGFIGNERAAAAFVSTATERWSFEAIYRDAAELGANFAALQKMPAHIGARWRTQPELQELFAGLPAGETGDLAAWRKGLEVLWAAGGEAKLRELLLGK